MVRLGGKSTDRTKDLSLNTLQRTAAGYKLSNSDWNKIRELEAEIRELDDKLKTASTEYKDKGVGYDAILQHLEFDEVDAEYYAAFQVPLPADGERLVGRGGKAVGESYLIDQWVNGRDAGVFRNHEVAREASNIWKMDRNTRIKKYERWCEEILKDQVERLHTVAKRFDLVQNRLDTMFDQKVGLILASKRIIGCTTTAAAKYREQIGAAEPHVLLVEEAGEILESHILTSMGSTVEKLILIGDHKYVQIPYYTVPF